MTSDEAPLPNVDLNDKAEVVISEETLAWLQAVKPGDTVVCVSGISSIELRVDAVDDEFIHCATLRFSRKTSAEVDDTKGFTEFETESFIVPPAERRQ